MKLTKKLLGLLTLPIVTYFFALPLSAQVTIGEQKDPNEFSILEISAEINKGGLRMPQLTNEERDGLSLTSEAKGLCIFNTETKCIEFWNGSGWISLCANVLPPPPATTFGFTPWVGTFHRHNEKGERIIYSGHTGPWTATVDDQNNTGAFVILDTGGGNIYGKLIDMLVNGNPGNPEDPANQLSGNTKTVSGTGNILFRVGLTGTYGINQVRYATITLTHSSGSSKLYVRQGEEPQYAPGTNSGVKWSPYNLGNTGNPNEYGANSNGFVDYPTKAGYFYKWNHLNAGTPTAYTPIDPLSPSWSTVSGSGLVCPSGYRLPSGNSGTNGEMGQLVSISLSLPLSLGYYADGFFDRRPIDSSVGAVSVKNNNVAYFGKLFYNSTSRASLFFPFAGNRVNGELFNAGSQGSYWSNSSYNTTDAYSLFLTTITEQSNISKDEGYSVRCVQ